MALTGINTVILAASMTGFSLSDITCLCCENCGVERLLCLLCFTVDMRGRGVEREQLGHSSACFGFRYLNMACPALKGLWIMFRYSHCLSTCERYEREETGFSSPPSLNSNSLKSLLEKILDTHHGHLHTWTHTCQEGKVCVMKTHLMI